jgi:hypothetical protein
MKDEGGRMKRYGLNRNERRWVVRDEAGRREEQRTSVPEWNRQGPATFADPFILHPSSFIIHNSSFILHH